MLLQVSKTIEVDNINLNTNCSPKLSVQNEKDMAKCYQLVIAFGLLPYLLPRVGVPAQKRSKWNNLCSISANISDEQVSKSIVLILNCQFYISVLFLEIFTDDNDRPSLVSFRTWQSLWS